MINYQGQDVVGMLTWNDRFAWFSLAVLLIVAGCGDGTQVSTRWFAEFDTVGDTVVVRTLSGSIGDSVATLVPVFLVGELEAQEEYVFGDIQGLAVDSAGAVYVTDAQFPAVRKYGPDGRHIMTLGREGSGPGEYRKGADALAVLRDGRIVLRDQGNSRFQLWTADGEPAGTWSLRTGFSTGTVHEETRIVGGAGILVDTAGFVYRESSAFDGFGGGRGQERTSKLVRYSTDNTALDTLNIPDWPYEVPTITARVVAGRGSGGMGSLKVPFSPSAEWAFSPLGYLVAGLATDYAVSLMRRDGVLRIERAIEPVPVSPDERANAQEVATDIMRNDDPSWNWSGAAIPDTKPFFLSLLVSQEGRIWLRVSQSGVRIPDAEVVEPDPAPDGRRRVVSRWREPIAFDVFEPDGRYVGRVHAPMGFLCSRDPSFAAIPFGLSCAARWTCSGWHASA
jgi:hypothetical protein